MRLIEYTVQKKRSVNLKTQQEKLSQMKHTREKAKKCTEISGLWGNGKWSNKLVIAASQRAGRKKRETYLKSGHTISKFDKNYKSRSMNINIP